jgi:hypothetical protein
MTTMHANLRGDSGAPMTKRAALLKALAIAITLPIVACSNSPTYTRAVGPAIGSAPAAADPPGGGIINRDEYEHSPSYPPG